MEREFFFAERLPNTTRPRRESLMHCKVRGLLAGLLAAVMAHAASAQEYPNRAIRLVVPYAAGGSTDTYGRILGQQLSEELGQPVVIDNRPGAATNVGTHIVAKAAPDGYTLLFNSTTFAINPSIYKDLPFHPIKDFTPIALVGKAPQVIAVHSGFAARNMKELIALAKAQPGKLSYGTAGNGTTNHLLGELLKHAARIDLLHVPYKGGSPAAIAVLGKQIDMMVSAPGAVMPYLKDGRMRVLAVSTAKRSPSLPAVPTIAESALPGFEVSTWWGVIAPAGLSKPVAAKLSGAVNRAMQTPVLRKRLEEEGAVAESSTPEQMAAFIRAELPKWAEAVKLSGAKAD
jgi:tripartite-type tricarboxylate transporter receptor subunit TctC